MTWAAWLAVGVLTAGWLITMWRAGVLTDPFSLRDYPKPEQDRPWLIG